VDGVLVCGVVAPLYMEVLFASRREIFGACIQGKLQFSNTFLSSPCCKQKYFRIGISTRIEEFLLILLFVWNFVCLVAVLGFQLTCIIHAGLLSQVHHITFEIGDRKFLCVACWTVTYTVRTEGWSIYGVDFSAFKGQLNKGNATKLPCSVEKSSLLSV